MNGKNKSATAAAVLESQEGLKLGVDVPYSASCVALALESQEGLKHSLTFANAATTSSGPESQEGLKRKTLSKLLTF